VNTPYVTLLSHTHCAWLGSIDDPLSDSGCLFTADLPSDHGSFNVPSILLASRDGRKVTLNRMTTTSHNDTIVGYSFEGKHEGKLYALQVIEDREPEGEYTLH
jgi:hypothetical protein